MNDLAHIRTLPDGTQREQSAAEHCRNTATYAAECLKTAGIATAGELAGLLHDAGKFQPAFQEYLRKASRGEAPARGSVIHTFQGCRMLLEELHGETPDRYEDITCELLAYAVGAHHGLFDCVDEHRKSGYAHRMTAEQTHYEEAVAGFTSQCAARKEVGALFDRANRELSVLYDRIAAITAPDGDDTGRGTSELLFYLGMLSRLILSAVIEGDRRDTAEFMADVRYPEAPADMQAFWGERLAYMERRLGEFQGQSQINQARQVISDQCREFAEKPEGVYRLHVPTGGGKTLASLRYALAHAGKWKKKRVIFTSPLLAILEQNARVIRDYIGDDSVILEHHSNVIHTKEEAETLDCRELLTENWDAPVLITTLVQLLNVLFDGRTTSIRRFQALCDSVIVIDEVQTVPNRLLTMFNLAVNFLSEFCHATIILCSATQPCLEKTVHPLLRSPEDIIPRQKALWRAFERTILKDAGGRRLEEIPDFVREKAEDAGSLLVICNKKQEAEYIFRQLSGEAYECFHLSASMCMQHRRDVLEQMEQVLAASRDGGKQVVCVSTQVVEAGVDLSFACVIRLTAGMDSVIQAAGRCNRNGEHEGLSPVYILQCTDEKLGMLREIRDAKTASIDLLEAYRRDAGRFSDNPASDAAIRYFYQKLYAQMPEEYQDYMLPKRGYSLYSLLSDNRHFADEDCECCGTYCLNQAFGLAGKLFTVFDEETEDVVVPYGEGERLIEELCSHGGDDLSFLAGWLARARPYTVSLYRHQKRNLEPDGLFMVSGVLVLRAGFYDDHTGLRSEQGRLDFLEV